MTPDLCVGKGRLETTQAAQRAESSPTENSSLNKYTNLDPCCYGNLLVEFHHQGYFYCFAAGHTHTLRWLADCRPTSPVIGYLLPFCQPSVLFPSHIIKSPMGTFFLLPHHLSLFPLLLGEKGDSKMSTKGRILVDETCTQVFLRTCSTRQKMKALSALPLSLSQGNKKLLFGSYIKTLEALIFSTLDCSSALFRWASKKAKVQ